MELTPQSLIEPNTHAYIKNGNYTIKFFKDPVTDQLIQYICVNPANKKPEHKITTIDIPNPTYAEVIDNTLDYTINYNSYGTHILITKNKTLHNNDYVATNEGLFIIDIPEDQSIVSKQPEKLILPLTNVITGESITMLFTDIKTKQDDVFYHNLYNLYTGEPTETRGYLKAAHLYNKEFKAFIDHAILTHALSSENAFKQALNNLCDEHDGYIHTHGTVNDSNIQYYTSLNSDTVITTESKHGPSNYAMHLKKRTTTPIHRYMKQIADLQPKGSLYEAIENLNKQFAQNRNFRPKTH